MSDYPLRLVKPEERAEHIVTQAITMASDVCGPVAHIVVRGFVHSLGGTPQMADEAERQVSANTGIYR